MRVGVNTLFLIPREVGGTETYVRSISPALQQSRPEIELVVITNRENHESFAEFEWVLIDMRARSRPKRFVAEQRCLPLDAKRAGIGLLNSPRTAGPLRPPCPQVVTVHDTQFINYPDDFVFVSRMAQRIIAGKGARRS